VALLFPGSPTRHERWQLRQDLPFSELVSRIDVAAAEVVLFLRIGHDPPCITACWMNILAPMRPHPAHSHPNNGAETVNFHDPRPQTGTICPLVNELTADNTDQVVVNVRVGTLLLSPPGSCFNLMFRTYAETMSKLMW
jgi:hypothetical protein